MEKKYYSIPVIQVMYNSITIYQESIHSRIVSQEQIDKLKQSSKKESNGYMSRQTRSKVSKYISNWISSVRLNQATTKGVKRDSNHYINFVTLTLPAKQLHSDLEIKRKCLNRFLVYMQRKAGVTHFFWRAEAQKNGNIHFHIIFDKFIDKILLESEWHAACEVLGYVTRFEAVYNHRNPPSVNVQKLRKIKCVEAYLIKYVCKTDGYRVIKGRIHGCSDKLRDIKPFSHPLCGQVANVVNRIKNDSDVKVIEGEGFTIIKCRAIDKLKLYSNYLYSGYLLHLKGIYSYLYDMDVQLKKGKEVKNEICDKKDIVTIGEKCAQRDLFGNIVGDRKKKQGIRRGKLVYDSMIGHTVLDYSK